tara:strand:+ start:1138 stop:1821 length:684 start_codon:yes stop_codon:yes gene_type:complete
MTSFFYSKFILLYRLLSKCFFVELFLKKAQHINVKRLKNYIMNLPNIITILRLFLTPLIVWLVLTENYILGFIFFVFSGLSDALDGYLAKKFNQSSLLGSYLDPIADKILIVSTILVLGYNGLVPIWLIIIIVSRDIAIFGAVLISFIIGSNLKIKPLTVSKINTFLQIFYIGIIFLIQFNIFLPEESIRIFYLLVTYLIAISTIVSWLFYLQLWLINMKVINSNEE